MLLLNNLFSISISFFLLLSGCTQDESTIWSKPIGSSVFKGFYGSKDEKKEEKLKKKAKPLVTYGVLKDNISGDITAEYTNNMDKITVGKKLISGFTGEWYDKNLEPVIKGRHKVLYDNLQGPFPPNISGFIPDGDTEFPPPIPDLPFADLNTNPIITSPFASFQKISKAPPTEFFFDDVTRKPPFLE